MKIALIDDERPSRSELKHLILQALPNAFIEEADSGQKAIELASNSHFDAFFIDIHLGDINGTDLSIILKKMCPNASIVFATAYHEFAVKAFDIDAADYILKPFDPQRVDVTIQKILTRQNQLAAKKNETLCPCKNTSKLSIWCDKKVTLVDIKDIAYIETNDRSCTIHTKKGSFSSTHPLRFFQERLPSDNFFRIHKSYIINLDYIIEIVPWFNNMYCIKLLGFESESLPISRKQIKLLRDIFYF